MLGSKWTQVAITAALGISLGRGWAQTKVATLDLTPYGVMTQAELNVQNPIPDPPPQYKGYTVAGPPDGIAWSGVGTVAIDAAGKVYVGLPIWASGYAPKNPVRGTGDKFRLLVVNGGTGKVEGNTDFPSKSLDRLALHLADDGTILVFANDSLMRVASNGKPTTKLAVPNEQKRFDLWEVDISTTGRTLRLRLNNQHTMFVNAKTLTVAKQCQEATEDDDMGTMTDYLELTRRSIPKSPNNDSGLDRETFCGKAEMLDAFGTVSYYPAVLNDNQFLAIAPGAMALRKLSGETVWSTNPPTSLTIENYDGHDELSRDGSRVALRLMRTAQYQPPETIQTEPKTVEDSVGVWDVATGHLLSDVPLLGHTTDRFFNPISQIALSPDGKLLAVLEDGVLTVWRID